MGVSTELIEWLLELDKDVSVAVRTPWVVEVWEAQGITGFEQEDSTKSPSPSFLSGVRGRETSAARIRR